MHETERGILNEVHIYLNNQGEELPRGSYTIPFSDIREIRIIEKDTGKTTASYVFGTLGIVLGAFVVIGIIVALTKSSCPYVYSHDGESFLFEGEIFGGAIGPNLQREDYLPLPSLKSADDLYRLRISNELHERQYTDLAQLVVVEHPENQKVLLDKSGKPHLLKEVERPTSATSYSGENLISSLAEKDREVFFFNDEDYSNNGIIMKFEKPQQSGLGKLVLQGKNTLWFDYQFGEFLKKFGGFYNEWMDKQSKISSEERTQRIIDNDFPLSIYLKQNNQWELVDRLFTVGPLALRDFVVPVDLSKVDSDQVEIKIETGFMFWELDYVGMDFTEDQQLKIGYFKPIEAFGTGSIDWTKALEAVDKQYMVQEEVGEVTEIIYREMKPTNDNQKTCFLHTNGYYELIREFDGLPKIVELNKFKEPGYFSEFSRANYLNILRSKSEIASVRSIN
jgi:hypothetical protein